MNSTAAAPINASTELLGVIGQPIHHSLSPVMHNAAIAELGLNWRYLAFAVAPDRLQQAIEGLAAMGCRGLSVTIPHKETVQPLLSSVDAVARELGAVNCLIPDGQGGWRGTNTDWSGFLTPLSGRLQQGGQALILGSGGVVRAVLRSCCELGIEQVVLRGRNRSKLEALAADVSSWAPPLLLSSGDEPLEPLLERSNLVVNGTPLGMAEMRDQTPLSAQQLALLPASAVVYDVVYTPRPTLLLKLAAQRGLSVFDGLEMLVQQGAAALKLWTGLEQVPVDAMRRAAALALEPGAADHG